MRYKKGREEMIYIFHIPLSLVSMNGAEKIFSNRENHGIMNCIF